MELGLMLFMPSVGLNAGGGIIDALTSSGPLIILGGAQRGDRGSEEYGPRPRLRRDPHVRQFALLTERHGRGRLVVPFGRFRTAT
jgi:hypothetical protein